jgi:hypothetical protein
MDPQIAVWQQQMQALQTQLATVQAQQAQPVIQQTLLIRPFALTPALANQAGHRYDDLDVDKAFVELPRDYNTASEPGGKRVSFRAHGSRNKISRKTSCRSRRCMKTTMLVSSLQQLPRCPRGRSISRSSTISFGRKWSSWK